MNLDLSGTPDVLNEINQYFKEYILFYASDIYDGQII